MNIKLAPIETEAHIKEYGYDSQEISRCYQPEMIQFMNQFNNVAMK